jgi:hypothetical protein
MFLSQRSSGIAGHGKHTLLPSIACLTYMDWPLLCPSDDLTLYPRVWAVERMHALDVLMTR